MRHYEIFIEHLCDIVDVCIKFHVHALGVSYPSILSNRHRLLFSCHFFRSTNVFMVSLTVITSLYVALYLSCNTSHVSKIRWCGLRTITYESGFGSRESGAGNREPGIGSRESGTGNRELGIGS